MVHYVLLSNSILRISWCFIMFCIKPNPHDIPASSIYPSGPLCFSLKLDPRDPEEPEDILVVSDQFQRVLRILMIRFITFFSQIRTLGYPQCRTQLPAILFYILMLTFNFRVYYWLWSRLVQVPSIWGEIWMRTIENN